MHKEMPDNYTVIDIETTGLSPYNDEIIELSGLKIRNNKVVEEFSSLINPQRDINLFISNLTGITNTMLKTAPQIQDILPKFIEFISDDTILGHNIRFDMGFIQNKLQKYFNKSLNNKTIDTRNIAKTKLNLGSYKLTNIAQQYDINTENNHRGLKDCYITYEVYNNLTGKTEPEFIQQSLL